MITQRTKEKILESSRIDEVVGDFVKLKRRGVNLIGLCPFHHEKTPSFNVNIQRNIFKCFGCGKGGDSVKFVMDHEHYTYPEALKYLANKYHIEIEEHVMSDEEKLKQQQEQSEQESLYVVSSFAQKYFTETLLHSEEGKAKGLSYFKEREFKPEIIEKFQLGYSPETRDAFSKAALEAAYQLEYLVKTGLTIQGENENQDPNGEKRTYIVDRFRGRVMFPIHSLTGRVIGFGGRILRTDVKTAKYLNSPDSDIYHKSQVLYGLFFAKKEILAKDTCYLVEGYTDVISMHQNGIENVVSSSGTSLTVDQIRLIGRFTKNITVLYDGDAAGIKASMRGIDMILEEGLNVRIVLFPDGDDPDSFARKQGGHGIREFLNIQSKDFISFKTGLLMKEAANDPVKKVELVRDIVESIARVQDPILRSEYIKACSVQMDISEQVLIAETNKSVRRIQTKAEPQRDTEELLPEVISEKQDFETLHTEYQERDILRILLGFGHQEIPVENSGESENNNESMIKISEFIIHEIVMDQLKFEHPLYERFFNLYKESAETFIEKLEEPAPKVSPIELFFLSHPDPEICSLAINLQTSPYTLSENWKLIHRISVPREEDVIKQSMLSAIYALKLKKVQIMVEEIGEKMKVEQDESVIDELIKSKQKLDAAKSELAKIKGTVVIR